MIRKPPLRRVSVFPNLSGRCFSEGIDPDSSPQFPSRGGAPFKERNALQQESSAFSFFSPLRVSSLLDTPSRNALFFFDRFLPGDLPRAFFCSPVPSRNSTRLFWGRPLPSPTDERAQFFSGDAGVFPPVTKLTSSRRRSPFQGLFPRVLPSRTDIALRSRKT